MAAKINRTGKTYGDLTVFETIPGSNSKADTYLVKCNCCGNTMIIGIDALLKGLKCKDCRGKDRKRTYQDLVGEEHNGIKVISLAEDAIGSTGHRNIRYNCMCSCGKEFVAYRSSLLRGKVKSCGCCKHITEASKMLVDNAEAMQDYDFAKNKDVDVSMLTQGSNIVVWWKCSACGTEWQASVYHYIQRIKSCPICWMATIPTIYPKSKKVNISSDTISSEAQTSRMPRRRKTGKPPKLKLIIRILRQPLQHKRRSNNV